MFSNVAKATIKAVSACTMSARLQPCHYTSINHQFERGRDAQICYLKLAKIIANVHAYLKCQDMEHCLRFHGPFMA